MVYNFRGILQNPGILKLQHPTSITIRRGKYPKRVIDVCCGFDIETTNIVEDDCKHAYMYHWQFSWNDDVILGRTWGEFTELLEIIKKQNSIPENVYIIVWIANESFEFQFMRSRIPIENVFAKENRQPIMFRSGCFEFRDALAVTGGNLDYLATNFTTTKKMVGDLDYNILRNKNTPLTTKELQYCINDVVILSEFSRYVFDKYIIPTHYIPLTKTGILRKKVTNSAKKIEGVNDAIQSCFPAEKLYNLMMKFLFRGGFTHGSVLYTGRILENVGSFDKKSSYPASMVNSYFPVTPFSKNHRISQKDFEKCIAARCCMFLARFTDFKTTSYHSIESLNKVVSISSRHTIDNGRIVSADYVEVFITELDFEIYKMFYTWSDMHIKKFWSSQRGRLPHYLLDNLVEEYTKKDYLKSHGKQDTPEYAECKALVNTYYGLMVTALHPLENLYENGEWVERESEKSFSQQIEKLVLLPQWGIWVTAHARHELLSVVHLLGNDVVYCDTDSIKCINVPQAQQIIDKYNQKMIVKNQKVCNENNYPLSVFEDIGIFENEGVSEKFKCLGSKRYINTKNGKEYVTIAGLPKGTLQNYCERTNTDIYKAFSHNMEMNIDYSNKLTTHYNDEPHSDIIDGVAMEELTSVCLYSIPFKMSLTQFYISYIEFIQNEKEKKNELH